MKKVILLMIGLVLLGSYALAAELEYFKVYKPQPGMTADEIMRVKYHNKYSLFATDYHQVGEVLYVDPSGFTRKRVWDRSRIVKAGKEGISYKDLVAMTYPAAVKGLAILNWAYKNPKREQDVWLWIPSLKKIRKTSASKADDSFMGSDFTVEEVSTRRFEDETYKLIKDEEFGGYKFEQTGEIKFKGKPCFVIEATPKRPHWYYSKRIVWVDKDTGGGIFEEYYDKNGKLFKTLFREWIWWTRQDKTYPSQISLECKDLRTGHRTVILMKGTEYDIGIPEESFTERQLSTSRW